MINEIEGYFDVLDYFYKMIDDMLHDLTAGD